MTTFNLKIFISHPKEDGKNEDLSFKKKKITSLETAQMMAIRGFIKELNTLPEKYKISSYEITLYIDILKSIKDFEEGNMKMFAFCFMVSRNYNFIYEDLKKDQNNMAQELWYIYSFFEPNLNFESFRDFCRDMYINCFVVCRARNAVENKIIEEEIED